jgi:uncharacterized membrane protein
VNLQARVRSTCDSAPVGARARQRFRPHGLHAALVVGLALAGLIILGVSPASALTLTTPYPVTAVQPGQTATLDITFIHPEIARVDIAVADVPAGWTATLRGGGREVAAVYTDPEASPRVQLEIDVPADAAKGEYTVVVQARGGGTTAELPLTLRVAEEAQGGTTLESEFPALRGPAEATFQFTVTLANDSPEERTYNISAEGPEGWVISLRPSGSERETPTVTVQGEGSQRLTLEATPPADTETGTYPLTVQAVGGGEEATLDLGIEITGTFDLVFTTPDERLNAEISAGGTTTVPLVLRNDGTGELLGVELSATPPTDWQVTFDPEVVQSLGAGETVEVTASFTPADNAIAGDYVVTVNARGDQATTSTDLRVTVRTSTWWGIIGVVIIVFALAALIFIFRRFGHR